MKFSEAIKSKLQAKGIPAANFAKHLNITSPSAHAILAGKTLPRKERLDEIFQFLDFTEKEAESLRYLYNEEKSKPKPRRQKASAKVLNKVERDLQSQGFLTVPCYEKLDQPDLFCHIERLGMLTKVGVWVSSKAISWDTVFTLSMKMLAGENLEEIIFIFTNNSGINMDDLRDQELFTKYKIRVMPHQEIEPHLESFKNPVALEDFPLPIQ